MGKHAKPQTDRFMSELKRLRNKGALEDEARGAVGVLFPKKNKNHQGYRARFMRVFKSSDTEFQEALSAWKKGAHIGKIVKLVSVTGPGGAPTGNLNALGKQSESPLDRMMGTWRAASTKDKDAFLKLNKLRRLP